MPPEIQAHLPRQHPAHVEASPKQVKEGFVEAVEAWGGTLTFQAGASDTASSYRGEIVLPLAAGLRRGVLTGRLEIQGEVGSGTRILLIEEGRTYHLHGTATAVLLIALAGALITFLWPFFPELLPLAAIGAILALSGWFLILSRLTTSGPEEFLELATELAAQPDDD